MKLFALFIGGFLLSTMLAAGDAETASSSSPKSPAWDGKESVKDYAKRANLKEVETLDFGDDLKIEMLLVPAGSFQMGSPESESKRDQDGPMEVLHKVTLTKPFYLAKFELTQAQYEKVMGANPSSIKDPKFPVTDITWADATAYCKKASEVLKRNVRLPSEAQWEYACRAGTQTTFYTGNEEADLGKAGWYSKNSERKLHAGGEKAANAFGLYDMLGNVRELCADFYANYDGKDTIDPTGPETGEKHISRGGAYAAVSHLICRCASRTPEPLDRKNGIVGLRVMLQIE